MSDSFDRIMASRAYTFDPNKPLEHQMPCEYAVTFQAWIDGVFQKHLAAADITMLNQLKIFIHDRFFQIHNRLPPEHRHSDSRKTDHPCVFSVFEAANAEIYEREIALAPPDILHPPKSSPPKDPPTRLTVLFLGDEDPEVDP